MVYQKSLFGWISIACVLLFCVTAIAQTPAKDKNAAPKVTVKRGKGGKKIFKIETGFVIEGRIQKPNAFYFLERAQINYNWLKLKKDFIPRILKATERSPF